MVIFEDASSLCLIPRHLAAVLKSLGPETIP